MSDKMSIIDVAIVGAGVSGNYAGWKLAEKHSNWEIHMFDANDRIGGRLYSIDAPGISNFKLEMGGMRYQHDHYHIKKAVMDLGLTEQEFTTPNDNNTLYYLRGALLTVNDVKHGKVPYKMTDEERRISVDQSQLYRYWSQKLITPESKSKNEWDRKCVDGEYAYMKGVYTAFLEVGSPDAITYLAYKGGFPGKIFNNFNYAEYSNTDKIPAQPGKMHTVREGFQQVPLRMHARFLNNAKSKYFPKHKLVSILHDGELLDLCFFDEMENKQKHTWARNVILGLPAEALKLIDFKNEDLSGALKSLLPAVQTGPATKTALVYNDPWWRKAGNGEAFERLTQDLKLIVTDLPLGMVLEIGQDQNGMAALLVYSAWWTNVKFWAPLMEKGTSVKSQIPGTEFMTTEQVMRLINLQLAQIFNIPEDQIPTPVATVSHAWYKEPYWTGWHNKVAGYHWPDVTKSILKPVKDKSVYIVGEAFSDAQTWVEGALETAQEVLTQYFDVDQPGIMHKRCSNGKYKSHL